MTDVILCSVAVVFVLWVLLLKSEVTHLKSENRRLAGLMRDRLKQTTGGVMVEKGRRLTSSEVQRLERGGGGAVPVKGKPSV